MEELHGELQQCYGAVRYRRSVETPPDLRRERQQAPHGPIPLQKVKRAGADPFATAGATPPGTAPLRSDTPPDATTAARPMARIAAPAVAVPR
jgi:hypothetical protein